MYKILKTTKKDFLETKELLVETGLFLEDVEKYFDYFLILKDQNSKIVACAGLEIYDKVGLLRSVSVKPQHQGKGLGKMITEEMINYAKGNGIQNLYLLTDTAQIFFSKFSFKEIERKNADTNIKNTYEFKYACKDTAILMMKKLL